MESTRAALIRYLMALRLSAGVALTYLPWDLDSPPHPVVRTIRQPMVGQFDPREVVSVGSAAGVVTLPGDWAEARFAARISEN